MAPERRGSLRLNTRLGARSFRAGEEAGATPRKTRRKSRGHLAPRLVANGLIGRIVPPPGREPVDGRADGVRKRVARLPRAEPRRDLLLLRERLRSGRVEELRELVEGRLRRGDPVGL